MLALTRPNDVVCDIGAATGAFSVAAAARAARCGFRCLELAFVTPQLKDVLTASCRSKPTRPISPFCEKT